MSEELISNLPKDLIINPVDLLEFQEKIKGNARGFNEAGDIVTQARDGAPLNSMWSEFQKTIALWNRQRSALISLMSYKVTQNVEAVRYPMQDDFEEATEFGQPKGIRLGTSFKMGFDFRWWDLAVRYTWQFLIDASSDQITALHNSALEADNRLVFGRVMRRIFNNVANTAAIDNLPVNVYPFWNGDSIVPPRWKNTVHTSGHDHYLASGGSTVVSDDIDDIDEHLYHHGYTNNNGYDLILLVNRQEGAVIRTFTVLGGASFTFIPHAGVGGGVLIPFNSGIVAAPRVTNLPGLNVIGTYGQFVVVEDDYIPAGYMLGLASGGLDNIGNPIGIREHENTSNQGLMLIKGQDNDYPLTDSYYIHGMGCGVRQRSAGVVMQITSGSYTIPTAYAGGF